MTLSATQDVRQAATAASAALPPSARISAPASAVAGWPAAIACMRVNVRAPASVSLVRGPWRLLVLVAGAAVAVALFLVLRSGDETDEVAPPPPPPPPRTATETKPLHPPPPPKPSAVVVRIAVRGGRAPLERITVRRGEQVVFVVTSDVVDHIHLHGYNVLRDVAPGKPARLAFRATIPGRFEVELEDRHVQIADLTVRP